MQIKDHKFTYESNVVAIIIFAYLWICVRLILNKGYIGQDYFQHLNYVRLILNNESLQFGIPDPFGLYYLAAFAIHLFSWKYGLMILSFLIAILISVSLLLLFKITRQIMCTTMCTLSLAYIATLPVLVTTSVVLASDGLVLFPFFLYCYFTYGLLKKGVTDDKIPFVVVLISMIQVIGIAIKFTYISMIAASFFVSWYVIFSQRFRLNQTRKFIIVVFILIIPAIVNSIFFFSVVSPAKLGVREGTSNSIMLLRSYFPYSKDIELLRAPSLGDPIIQGGRHVNVDLEGREDPKGEPGFELLVENRFSYPALVHLAINTDIRNLGYGEMTPSSNRTRSNQFAQILSVFFSLFLSIGVLIFNFDFLIRGTKWFILNFKTKYMAVDNQSIFFISVWLPAMFWFITIAASLPFVTNPVYRWGYWTPRLILPSVIVFGIVLFFGASYLKGIWAKLFKTVILIQIFLAFNIVFR